MDNGSICVGGEFLSWKCLCCYEPREHIWPAVYIQKWQKRFSGRGEKWKLIELMGNKINIFSPPESSHEISRGEEREHISISYQLIWHIFTEPLVPSSFSFIIGIITPKWQRANCSLACVHQKSRPGVLHVLEQCARSCGCSNFDCVWRVVSFLSALTKPKETPEKWLGLPRSFFVPR